MLGKEFDNKNHGVLSGFLMWKTIEEIFLLGLSEKHSCKFGISEFDAYTQHVLQVDIARCALGISLHALASPQSREAQHLHPVAFDRFPLAGLLILSDELQEYHRWEGTRINRTSGFGHHPQIRCRVEDDRVMWEVTFSFDREDLDALAPRAMAIRRNTQGQADDIETLEEAIKTIGEHLRQSINAKLRFNESLCVELVLLQDWSHTLWHGKLGA